MERFTKSHYPKSKYVFFTGKGGVGKTSVASSLAYSVANDQKRVLLISTDPASNLQDIFNQPLTNEPSLIQGTTSLYALNLDPVQAANDYKEQVIAPYRGKLPDVAIQSMEEQMSGACTVEIAAFNQFSALLTDQKVQEEFDIIIFDTAPTGHTLRLLQLPMAWSGFLADNSSGASCLGPLAGLEGKKQMYKKAVDVLSNADLTTLILVTRPDTNPLKEAARASKELSDIGIENQQLIINGLLEVPDSEDAYASAFYKRQRSAMENMPVELSNLPTYTLPLVPYTITSLNRMGAWFNNIDINESLPDITSEDYSPHSLSIHQLIEEIMEDSKRIIFTMGKGGVGKTTVATLVALGLAEKGERVHLTTTDPAAHIKWVLGDNKPSTLTISNIDPNTVLTSYKKEVLQKASESMDEEGLAFVREDLESPCTEEIAVFRAFAEVIESHPDEIIVIDTAPTGHTLLLLDSTESYHKEISRTSGEVPIAIQHLLPTLRDKDKTSILITTLPEATPVYEAARLQNDLKRAGLNVSHWIVNQSFINIKTVNPLLSQKAKHEVKWLEKINTLSNNHTVIIPWSLKEPTGLDGLHTLLEEK
ncbi:arsenical pump-driving ATPase [Rummeliibacillus sp. TYF005]|uniref:arsenical pump-driving ATPase n=1 Tax=Rummeliibacillus sp. TYF005 TaxID=2058214 RepID=UPI000F54BF7B|nr:arsenical pump-driving ATPase [Rummeliibacillus sp. TYF005]RPJ96407.1 arsenical pump-driving ATPase [Rummeliibacillus sp. TYF005]